MHFSSDFFATAAQIIPVLLLFFAFEGRGLAGGTFDKRLVAVTFAVTVLFFGEFLALIALIAFPNGATTFGVIVMLALTAAIASVAYIFVRIASRRLELDNTGQAGESGHQGRLGRPGP